MFSDHFDPQRIDQATVRSGFVSRRETATLKVAIDLRAM